MLKKIIWDRVPQSASVAETRDIDSETVKEVEIYTSPPPEYSPIRTERMLSPPGCGVITQARIPTYCGNRIRVQFSDVCGLFEYVE